MIAIAIVAAFYAEKKNILLIASFIAFALEFLILWIPATVDAFDFEHVIAALQGNPMAISNSYVQGLVSSAFWFGIFPTAAGIGLFIISFVLRGRTVSGWLWNVFLFASGAYGVFLGTNNLTYLDQWAPSASGADYLARSLRTIYSVQKELCILWIIAGTLLICTSLLFFAQVIIREARAHRYDMEAGTINLFRRTKIL